jgi:hypothetical protein
MTIHIHRWRKLHEQFLLGGSFPIGYECLDCGKFVGINDIPIHGIGGVDTKEQRVVGPHGAHVTKSDGSTCKEQILHADGTLEIVE